MVDLNDIFHRTEMLLGSEKLKELLQKKVILFGIGGVGSWCAESLIRTGISKLTIVDSDLVSVTNINRQLHATTKTIGKAKVEVLKNRLIEINPNAEIIAIQKIYNEESHPAFELETYDYIIDAIDSIDCKAHLIRMATQTKAEFFSSMGAARKIDPMYIKVAEFWKVHGCPLAATLRRKLKSGGLPSKKFYCVFSDEVMGNITIVNNCESDKYQTTQTIGNEISSKKKQNGSLVHITAIFGNILAGLVIKSIYQSN